jgi:hypothetical protein
MNPCYMSQSENHGPLRLIADAAADAICRVLGRAGRDQSPLQAEKILTLVPMVKTVVDLFRPPQPPADIRGPKLRQVEREFTAEEASLKADFEKARARLLAEFGPRFNQARADDDESLFDFDYPVSK